MGYSRGTAPLVMQDNSIGFRASKYSRIPAASRTWVSNNMATVRQDALPKYFRPPNPP